MRIVFVTEYCAILLAVTRIKLYFIWTWSMHFARIFNCFHMLSVCCTSDIWGWAFVQSEPNDTHKHTVGEWKWTRTRNKSNTQLHHTAMFLFGSQCLLLLASQFCRIYPFNGSRYYFSLLLRASASVRTYRCHATAVRTAGQQRPASSILPSDTRHSVILSHTNRNVATECTSWIANGA